MELWNNFCSLSPEMHESFISSCLCYQVAMDMRTTYVPVSYQLFVTAIEVIAKKVVEGGPTKRFIDFICQNLKQPDEQFRKKIREFYSRRSEISHEKGVGLGFIPSFGIRSFDEVLGGELWELEIIINGALIGFLKYSKAITLQS